MPQHAVYIITTRLKHVNDDVSQIPGIKGVSKDAERPGRSNCRYYPERNEEIKQILRTTRLCAGFEPVTSTNSSCTPTNLSHSRGVLSKQHVTSLGHYLLQGRMHSALLSLFEPRRQSDRLSIVHFVRPFVFTSHELFTFPVTSFLTDVGRHQTFHLA